MKFDSIVWKIFAAYHFQMQKKHVLPIVIRHTVYLFKA